MGYRVDTHVPELGTTVGAALLAPHRSYLSALEPLLERKKIHALAHITGGGFGGNIPRVLPAGLGARVRKSAWRSPRCSASSRRAAPSRGRDVPDLQHGDRDGGGRRSRDLHDVEHSLERRGETSFVIGSVVKGAGVRLE